MLRRRGLLRLVCSLAIIGVATLIRLPFGSALGDASPFLFYWPSVLIVAVLFGLRLGLLAIALAAIQANYFWMAPHRALAVNEVEFLQLLTFCFGSTSLAVLSEWLHREQRSKERFRATLAQAGEAIVTTDCEGRITFLNAAAQLLTGASTDEAVGQVFGGALLFLEPRDGSSVSTRFQELLTSDEARSLPHELVLVSKRGKQHSVSTKVTKMLGSDGQRAGAVIVLHSRESIGLRADREPIPSLASPAPACP